jgi:uncharacterized membrane protein YoaK (UPF0700 family)
MKQHNNTTYAEFQNADCGISFVAMLSGMLSGIMHSGVLTNVIMLNAILLSVIILCVMVLFHLPTASNLKHSIFRNNTIIFRADHIFKI